MVNHPRCYFNWVGADHVHWCDGFPAWHDGQCMCACGVLAPIRKRRETREEQDEVPMLVPQHKPAWRHVGPRTQRVWVFTCASCERPCSIHYGWVVNDEYLCSYCSLVSRRRHAILPTP